MATIINVLGNRIPLTTLTLDTLQAAVGGYVEHITLDDGSSMYLNEDGKFTNLRINREATLLARSVIGLDDYIVGPVVICAPEEDFDA
jgi:hypothetical protein